MVYTRAVESGESGCCSVGEVVKWMSWWRIVVQNPRLGGGQVRLSSLEPLTTSVFLIINIGLLICMTIRL
jgi:hypothetical protein